MHIVRRSFSTFGVVFSAIFLGAASPALAGSAPPQPKGWEFAITPYLWGAGLDGDVKVGRLPSAGVEASFSDLLHVLDFGLMGAFEARKDRWGVLSDAVYVKVQDTKTAPNPAFGDAEADVVQQMYSAAGTYRVLEGTTSVDVLVGARYEYISADLGLSGGIGSGRRVSDSKSWWDGFAGARVVYRPAKAWTVNGYLDVGAGGSKLSWQAVAGASYAFNKTVALAFGIRYLSEDYDNGTFVYDVAMAGPFAGVAFRF